MFELRKCLVHLLSNRHFVLFTKQQALKTVFAENGIHGLLARWLDFLAEYEFILEYQRRFSIIAADYLAHIGHGDKKVDGLNEKSIITVLEDPEGDTDRYCDELDRELHNVMKFLAERRIECEDSRKTVSLRVRVVASCVYLVKGSVILVMEKTTSGRGFRSERYKVMQSLHDEPGH